MLFFKKSKKKLSSIEEAPVEVTPIEIPPTEIQLQISRQLSELDEVLRKSIKRQRKVEDSIDFMSELIENHTNSFLTQEQIKTKEDSLIHILIEQDEYLFRLSHLMQQSTTSSNWLEQIRSIQAISRQKLRTLGLDVISDSQVEFDFHIHKIIDICPTTNIAYQNMVYQIITPGYIYGGTVLKQATIIAYKYEEVHQ